MSASPESGFSTGQVTPNESFPSTPKESFIPKRAMASFENLVALANHQERLKEAKRMVWRDKGQPVVEMETLQECFTHAMSGGFSGFYLTLHVFFYIIFNPQGSATLAFNIRASVNVILALIRIHRTPRLVYSCIQNEYFIKCKYPEITVLL